MRVLTVTAFLTYLNETFKAIWDATDIAIEGEVTGYRPGSGQWISFDLKDEQGLVNVFLPAWKLHVPIEDGMRVRVFGMPRIYPKYGKFSINAEKIELSGDGSLKKALALLRQKFQEEGLFDPTRKRPLPRFPVRIALIASRESAAYGDFLRIINERWRGLEIDSYHVLVQGERAPDQIVHAIRQANQSIYDAIVLTRGGGSLEELMAFNDERVVRAVFGSKIPMLVGIGHERDTTFSEEVADVRGSTPTDCARRLVPDRADILYTIAHSEDAISKGVLAQIKAWSQYADEVMTGATHWVSGVLARGEAATALVGERMRSWFNQLQERLTATTRLLVSFDPRRVMARGFAIVRDKNGRVQTDVKRLAVQDVLTVEMRDGAIEASVQSIKQKLI